jgi:HEAT repeat protein
VINLFCPKCQTVLPVREDKVGKSNYVCPQCYYPLELPASLGDLFKPAAAVGAVPANDHRAVPEDVPTLAAVQAVAAVPLAPSNKPPAMVARSRPAAPSRSAPAKAAASPRSSRRVLLACGAAGAALCLIALVVALVMRLNRGPADGPASEGTTAILEDLQDPDPQVRATAVRTIGTLGLRGRPLLVALVTALKDSDPEVRGLANETLDKRGAPDKADLPLLSLALEDPNSEVRLYAVGAVAELGPEARGEMPALRALVRDGNVSVSKAAGKTLQRLEQAELVTLRRRLENGSAAERAEAAQALADMGPSALPARATLMDAMTDKNSAVRTAAKGALARMGPDVVPMLAEALKDSRVETRRGAAEVLGLMGADARDVIPTIIASADDPAMRQDAVVALEKIGSEAVPTLVRALVGERDPARQAAIGDALVQIGPDVLPALTVALKNPRPEIRDVAARTRDRIVAIPASEDAEELTGKTALIFNELAGQFNLWDADKDGFLDKVELARAFRGPKATAPVFKGAPTAKELKAHPDAWFLARLDRDGDERISRGEFDHWARAYAMELGRAAAVQEEAALTSLELNQKIAALAAEQDMGIQKSLAQGQVAAALQAQQAVLNSALLREQAILQAQLLRLRLAEEAALVIARRRAGPVYHHLHEQHNPTQHHVARPVGVGVTLHPPGATVRPGQPTRPPVRPSPGHKR